MKNEHISIEIAKQLTELGLKKFSLEYWVKPTHKLKMPSECDWELLPYNQGLDVAGEDADGRGGKEWTVEDELKHPSDFWNRSRNVMTVFSIISLLGVILAFIGFIVLFLTGPNI